MLSDLRFALRQLRKTPGFTAVALLTLAFGIGANVALFSVMDRLLYRALPVPDPERLGFVAALGSEGRQFFDFNYPLYRDYARGNTAFAELSATSQMQVGVGLGGATERRPALLVSGNYFSMLQISAAVGRTFAPTEGVEIDDAAVAVISHRMWRDQFASDPGAIGRSIRVNGRPYTVIGVAPREFAGTYRGQVADLYLPITQYGQLTDEKPGGEHPLATRYFTWLQMMGRLKPDVTLAQAQTAMQALTLQVHASTPQNTPEKLAVVPGLQGFDRQVRRAERPLMLLRWIAALVLLVACANLANLQLARASGRAREFAVRIALGASRTRVWRGLLTESLLLSVIGGALGVLVAVWLTSVLQQYRMPDQAFDLGGELNVRLLAFAAGVSVLTGVVFGLAPAWQASGTQPMAELKAGMGVTEARGWRLRFRSGLIVLQVALSLMVLVSAGLFSRSLRKLQAVDPGFEPSRVVAMSLDLGLNNYTRPQALAFYQRLLERVRTLPGVESAALSWNTPLSGRRTGTGATVEGYTPTSPQDRPTGDLNFISPDYFRTLGVELVEGREFTAGDTLTSAKVAIVDEAFLQRYRPGLPRLGWHLSVGTPQPVEVVGVVRNLRGREVAEVPYRTLYYPFTQQQRRELTLLVRSGLAPAQMAAALRAVVRELDGNIPAFNVRTLEQQRTDSLALQRLTTVLLNGFGALTLLLAALGLYGVLAFSVGRRTREIGLRLALGAQIADIFRLILRQGFALVAVGLVIGLGGALAGARLLRSQLYAIEPLDPVTFGAAVVVFLLVGFLACYLPARRATRVNPTQALRAE